MSGSGLDRTDYFQKFHGSGLDRIQFYRIRIGLGLKNFTVRSSLVAKHVNMGGGAGRASPLNPALGEGDEKALCLNSSWRSK